MIQKTHLLSIRSQCQLLAIHRSIVYYKPCARPQKTALINDLVDLYRQYPMYGYRRLTVCLRRMDYVVNGKCVLRYMKILGIKAIYPGPRTTIADPSSKYYYLLKDMTITKAHQAWQIDITYLRTSYGFVYLNALIDVYSRYVVAWTLSNTLEVEACLRTVEKAIRQYGPCTAINSDQGAQFTSKDWRDALNAHGIKVSMSRGGCSNQNAHIERLWRTIKYEGIYIQGCRSIAELKKLLPLFINWYNHDRPHQALNYQTPFEVMKGADDQPDGYVDNANALTHIPTGSTTTNKKNSLIL